MGYDHFALIASENTSYQLDELKDELKDILRDDHPDVFFGVTDHTSSGTYNVDHFDTFMQELHNKLIRRMGEDAPSIFYIYVFEFDCEDISKITYTDGKRMSREELVIPRKFGNISVMNFNIETFSVKGNVTSCFNPKYFYD